jgi:hypothetical protein
MSGDRWDMDTAYPPVLWKDYQDVAMPLVAEWVRCAGLTCDNEYALYALAEELRNVVVQLLKNSGMTRVVRMESEHFRQEDE